MSRESRHSKNLFRALALAVVIAGIAVVLTGRQVRAQTAGPTPFPVMSAERAWAFVQAAERKLDYLPGEVIVKFRPGVTVTAQQRALMALRSRPAPTDLNWITADTALHRDQVESDATILAAQLREQPEVIYAEPNYLHHLHVTPNDPGFSAHQWNFTALDVPRAWDINPGGSSSLIVASVDTGVTTVTQSFSFSTWNLSAIQRITVPFGVSPDLSSSRLVSPADFITGNGPGVVLDMVGHGTHTASTIGENANNALAEAGLAFNVRIMPVKVCVGFWEVQFAMSANGIRGFAPLDSGGCLTAAEVQGIRYAADNGAKVINFSIGGPQPSLAVQDALNYAVGKGAFVAISAGNEFEEGNPVFYPAAYAANIDGAMSVGAVGPSLTRAYYSNTGSYVEIAAPGGNLRQGDSAGVWQDTIFGPDSESKTVIFPRFDRYIETPLQGTSMAAPHVAGIAALIMSQGVTNPALVEALIKKTARPLGTAGRNNEYGFGLVQPRAALFGFAIAK